MPKLTDTQLVILSAASQRKNGALLPLPKSLKLNKGTLTSVLNSLLKHGLTSERPAARDEDHWREEDGERLALVITESGLKALGVDTDGNQPSDTAHTKRANLKKKGKARAVSQQKSKKQTSAPGGGTKQALLIDLLGRKTGATIDEVIKATGWQAHSVRGAISGTLKKKLGLTVNSEPVDGRGRVYRIAAGR